MKKYPVWKHFLVIFVLLLGAVYAAPNLYPPDHAIQITGDTGGQDLSSGVLENALKVLEQEGIAVKATESTENNLLIRLEKKEDQLLAKDLVQGKLGGNYVVALNLAPTTPDWLMSLGAEPMKLGLDLSGGVHFLMEVDTDFAVAKRLDGFKADIKKELYEQKIRGFVESEGMVLIGKFKTEEVRQAAIAATADITRKLQQRTYEEDGNFMVEWFVGEAFYKSIGDEAVAQNLEALRNRVNALGVSEPLVQRQGAERIVVELPGVQDSARAKRIIGKIANLEFRLACDGKSSCETFDYRSQTSRKKSEQVLRSYIITGESVAEAQMSFDENAQPMVRITLDGQGGKRMHQQTKNNVGRQMAVLFIETKQRIRKYKNDQGEIVEEEVSYQEKSIISFATIQSALGVNFQITGLDSVQEAKDLAILLKAGALSAPIKFVEERTIGPSLGEENIALGVNAIIWGMTLVLCFMLVYYKVFGFAANLALGVNIILIVAAMSIFSATLTLPGIAGIVLTIGMAVDANVLIFARIKEELKEGLSPLQAISSGYDRAFVTIMDANITTFLVALILFAVGTGPVKGFAVTLMIGILTSMFTAIIGTRSLISLIYRNHSVKKLAI